MNRGFRLAPAQLRSGSMSLSGIPARSADASSALSNVPILGGLRR